MEATIRANYFDIMGKAKKSYAKCMEPICKKWGMTRNEVDILLFLHNNPGLDRAVDIVTCRGIAKSHVSVSLSSLESRGLVVRRLDAADRRTVHLKLTERAVPIAEEGAVTQRRFFERVFAGLTAEEQAINWAVAEKIGRNIEKMDTDLESIRSDRSEN